MVYSALGKHAECILREVAPDLFSKCHIIEAQTSTRIDIEYNDQKISVFFEEGERAVRARIQEFVSAIRSQATPAS